MGLLDKLHGLVTSGVRHKGRALHLEHRVTLKQSDDRRVVAELRGLDGNDTVVVERNGDELLVACTCPHLNAERLVCKHVWATMLAANERGALGAAGDPAARFIVGRFAERASSPRRGDGPARPASGPRGASTPAATPAAVTTPGRPGAASLPWAQALERLRAAPPAATPPRYFEPWPAGRILYYVIDLAATERASDGIVLDLLCRDRLQSGGLGKHKSVLVPVDAIHLLADPGDHATLRLLIGPSRVDTRPGLGDFRTPICGPLRLPAALLEPVLRAACATGRCLLRDASGAIGETPLGWDDGPPWQLQLDVAVLGDGSFALEGGLVRGDERRGFGEFVHFSRDALAISPRGIVRLVPDRSIEWLRALAGHGRIVVPAEGRDALAEALATRPATVQGNVPEELRLAQVEVAPQPCLVVRKPKEPVYWAPARLDAALSFAYDGVGVEPGSSVLLLRDPASPRLIRRDLEQEAAARTRLLEVGLVALAEPSKFQLAPVQLPAVVGRLLGLGWRVEADGQLYRRSGSFRLAVRTGVDWFELEGGADFDGVTVPVPRLLAAMRKGESTVTLDDGSLGVLPEDWLKRYGMLADLADARGQKLRYSRSQAGLLDALLAALPEATCDETLSRLRAELRGFEGVTTAQPGRGFKGQLRPYQCGGLAWLQFLERFGFGGCLADDMGLGKTVQVLAHLATRERRGPTLVVAPRSLVFHWREEARRFAPKLSVLDHATPDRRSDAGLIARHDLVLTTYGLLRRDIVWLKDIPFDVAILDEAQAVKNARTDTAKAVRLVQAKHRLALSGTPVENHLGELWSLFEFLNPGMLGGSTVFKRVALESRDLDEDMRTLLRRALRPFLLRRTKEAVAPELPERVEETLWCDLAPAQRKLYDELRDHYRASLLGKLPASGLKRAKIQVLEALLRLRQAACHPGLVSRAHADAPSTKLDDLLPQLEEVIDGGHKALVFSQFTSFLALLRQRLDAQGIAYAYLDGQTADREQAVARFQGDPACPLFLISLKAGGLGLNLTAASYVFLLDPWWNPAAEAQAIDRAHRIGQTRNVFAYRLIARDTIEERVVELQRTKRALADAILGADESLVASLTREDLELLLG